jgi:hypothetical protein
LSDLQRQKACLTFCGVDYEYGEAIMDRLQTGFLSVFPEKSRDRPGIHQHHGIRTIQTGRAFGARGMEGWALSSAQIQPDQEVVAFWTNPANDWNALLARVATWDKKAVLPQLLIKYRSGLKRFQATLTVFTWKNCGHSLKNGCQ